MRTLTHWKSFLKTFGLAVALSMMVAGPGCASYSHRRPDPVTVDQILDMSKNGVAPEEIISRIKASGTVYRLKASQLTELEKQGVPAAVIDYMQQTYLDAVKRDSGYDNWRYWTMYDDYWYGGAPFGWPYDTVYVIRAPRVIERSEPPPRERHEAREREHEHGRL